MNSFITRACSAFIAVAVLFVAHFFAGVYGLAFVGSLVVLLVDLEGKNLLFPNEERLNKAVFLLVNFVVFVFVGFSSVAQSLTQSDGGKSFQAEWQQWQTPVFAFACVLIFTIALMRNQKFVGLERLFAFQTKALFGIFYLGVLPGLVMQILFLKDGLQWFIALLLIVFFGDTAAYLVGSLVGKNKLMPKISPKKSIEGSIGGLGGSIVAALVISWLLLPEVNLYFLILLSILMGLFAQMGDLFESMLKRVANVKDSGGVMPGHGGLLDRIDGVLFAAPVLHLGLLILKIQT